MTAACNESGTFVALASYPKSGNTWVRACLTAYLTNRPVDLGTLIARPILFNRHDFDDFTGLSSADMALQEIDLHRPGFHRALAQEHAAPWFVKVHDTFYRNAEGAPVFARESFRGAVYIVRHPAAVAASFAHHRRRSIDNTIDVMANSDALLDYWGDAIDTRLPQRLSSWSEHAASWLEQRELPVLLVRYEDLSDSPAESLARIVGFAGLDVDATRIARAVAATEFATLQKLEAETGFREAPLGARPFFRAGKPGDWRTRLTQKQRAQIVATHRSMMARLGYEPRSAGTG